MAERNNLMQELITELKKAHAPITKLKVACLIKTKKSKYFGHNFENKNYVFIHAEENALKSMEKNHDFSKIEKIYMAGQGQEKLRKVMPCINCFSLLLPHFTKKSKIVLFKPNTLKTQISLNFSQIKNVYSKKDYSELHGKQINDILKELTEKTPLQGTDLEFIANLRLFGIKQKIAFYLTGSKSGRVEISNIIHSKLKQKPDDLDLIAITNHNKKIVEKEFTKLTKRFYTIKKKELSQTKVYFPFKKVKKFNFIKYLGNNNKKIIDLVIAKNPKNGFTRQHYYENNLFHKIS